MTKQEQIKFLLEEIRDAAGGVRLNASAVNELVDEPSDLAASVLRLTDTCNQLERNNNYLQQTASADGYYIKVLKKAIQKLRRERAEADSNLDAAERYIKELKNEITKQIRFAANLRNDRSKLLRENAALKQDLKTDEAYVEKLRQELDVAIRSNVWLRERLNFKDQSLRACRKAEEALKKQLTSFRKGWCPYSCTSIGAIEELKAEIALQDELLKEAETLEKQLASLKEDLEKFGEAQQEIDKQNRYIKLLKTDRRILQDRLAYRRTWNKRR